MQKPSSDSVRLGQVVVFTAALTAIKCDMYRHVAKFPACGKVSLGLGTIVAVSSVLVHSVEGLATGLYGSCSGGA